VSHNSRDADDEIHLSLVGDARKISSQLLTLETSRWLIELRRRDGEPAVRAAVVLPTGSNRV